ncbi:MAG: hypothetical protein HYV27_09870 [Candidatus Hydrogenedentes bacterium]|nr:hypothetical protein [Candidatus Hydrogenedentota bacterium]
MKRKRFLLPLGVLAVLLAAGAWTLHDASRTVDISLPEELRSRTAGGLERVEQAGHYPALLFRAMLAWGQLPDPIPVTSGAYLYRVEYWTPGIDGALTLASGLLAVPTANTFRGTVSYHHGTNSSRHDAPSAPSLGEGVLGAALLAGGGYVFLAPDYIGLGSSDAAHPYLHAGLTSSTVIDFMRAARSYVKHARGTWPARLYLTGFSQGGHATAVVQRDLEALADPEFHVAAAAPIAGAYDLADVSFPYALANRQSLYLAYLSNAYATVYKHPLNSILTEEFATRVPVLFDGEHDVEAILAALPGDPRDLFNAAFLADYDAQKPTWFTSAMRENQAFDWIPKAPIRAYHGENDLDVNPEESRSLVKRFQERGAQAEFISVGPYAHNESVFYAIGKVRAWFDELSAPALQ